jgi:hypothetical protein
MGSRVERFKTERAKLQENRKLQATKRPRASRLKA